MKAPIITARRAVYRSAIGRAGRPWRFTKIAALRDYAAAKFWERHPCECDRGDNVTPPDTCEWHRDAGREWRIAVIRRYARLLARRPS